MAKYTTLQNMMWLMGFGSLSVADAKKMETVIGKHPDIVQKVMAEHRIGVPKDVIAQKYGSPIAVVDKIIRDNTR